jgi:hypothetical protein
MFASKCKMLQGKRENFKQANIFGLFGEIFNK